MMETSRQGHVQKSSTLSNNHQRYDCTMQEVSAFNIPSAMDGESMDVVFIASTIY